MVFTGDTLFKGSWGRTDLPTSSFEGIIDSITNKLMPLPAETIAYPGHRTVNNIRRRKTGLLRTQGRKLT